MALGAINPRMKGRYLLAPTAVALVLATQPAAAAPLQLDPTSKWVVDYREDSCRLSRQFGAGDQQVLLLLSRYGPGDTFRMTIAGKPTRALIRPKIRLRFEPNEEEQQLEAVESTLGKLPAILFSPAFSIDKYEGLGEYRFDDPSTWPDRRELAPQRFAAVRNLTVGVDRSKPLVLRTGPLDKAFGVMTSCIDNLLTSWGVDPAREKSLQRRPTPKANPADWITTSDYPADMVAAGQPAIVEFRLNIDATGAVTACHIQETTRAKAFDDAVCKSMIRRAKFNPAIDANGVPVASYWRQTVRFLMP